MRLEAHQSEAKIVIRPAKALPVCAAMLAAVMPAQAFAQSTCAVTHMIHAVQGNATNQLAGGAHDYISPLNGQDVTIEGVVVGDYQSVPQSTRSGELRGFFVEEEADDQDADGTTSEGLFIFTGSTPVLDVQEGERICIRGRVSEFFGMTQLTATAAGSLVLTQSGAGLPDPATLELPVVGDLNDYYERFEGMRVQFSEPLFVSEYFELARYGQIVLTQDRRPYQYTHLDATPSAAEYAQFLDSLARRRVVLDDVNNTQNAPLPGGVVFHPQPGGLATGDQGVDFFRGGDRIEHLIGVLHWSFAGQTGTDAWRIRPTQSSPVIFSVANPRPTDAPPKRGSLRVATFNVLNYFPTIDTTSSNDTGPCGPSATLDCRGADSVAEFDRQNEKLIAALRGIDADVFGLVEIENSGTAAAELVSRLNAAIGTPTYAAINTGVLGTDAITVAVLYKTATVRPKGLPAVLTEAAFVDPNNTGLQRNRPAIAQTFESLQGASRKEAFTVVVNHLKSKGAGGEAGADVDQLDGQSAWNDTRTRAAAHLVGQWLPSDPTGQRETDILIMGDLNAYRGEAPVTAIRQAGYVDLHRLLEGPSAYSYVFDGQLGYLDHALANGTMTSQVACQPTWLINADEVPLFDYNDTVRDTGEATFEAEPTGNNLYEPNSARTSDHDPIIVDLNLCPSRGLRALECQVRNALTRLECRRDK